MIWPLWLMFSGLCFWLASEITDLKSRLTRIELAIKKLQISQKVKEDDPT